MLIHKKSQTYDTGDALICRVHLEEDLLFYINYNLCKMKYQLNINIFCVSNYTKCAFKNIKVYTNENNLKTFKEAIEIWEISLIMSQHIP